jgi:ABC-2 type transport system ATP-binding protein
MTPASVIEVDHLSKAFSIKQHRPGVLGTLAALAAGSAEMRWAVRDLCFTVAAGEMVGYIGPNGAGKSTTVKMLTGILMPTSGRLSVGGLDPSRQRREHAARIGVVFGQRTQLWWDLPLEESFDLLRAIYRIPADRYRTNLKRFRALLELDEFLRTPVRQLSLGQRMRGDLAAALLHDPPVVFLDEPTIGLDVVAKERIREFLAVANREQGVTVLLTTHDMGDIEKLCRRVMIIDQGRLLYNGPLQAIRERYGRHRVLVIDLQETRPEAEVRAAAAMVGVQAFRRSGVQEDVSECLDVAPQEPEDPNAQDPRSAGYPPKRRWMPPERPNARTPERLNAPAVELLRSERQRHWIRFDRSAVSAAELISAVSSRLPVMDLAIEEPEIEGIIARIYREGIR